MIILNTVIFQDPATQGFQDFGKGLSTALGDFFKRRRENKEMEAILEMVPEDQRELYRGLGSREKIAEQLFAQQKAKGTAKQDFSKDLYKSIDASTGATTEQKLAAKMAIQQAEAEGIPITREMFSEYLGEEVSPQAFEAQQKEAEYGQQNFVQNQKALEAKNLAGLKFKHDKSLNRQKNQYAVDSQGRSFTQQDKIQKSNAATQERLAKIKAALKDEGDNGGVVEKREVPVPRSLSGFINGGR